MPTERQAYCDEWLKAWCVGHLHHSWMLMNQLAIRNSHFFVEKKNYQRIFFCTLMSNVEEINIIDNEHILSVLRGSLWFGLDLVQYFGLSVACEGLIFLVMLKVSSLHCEKIVLRCFRWQDFSCITKCSAKCFLQWSDVYVGSQSRRLANFVVNLPQVESESSPVFLLSLHFVPEVNRYATHFFTLCFL